MFFLQFHFDGWLTTGLMLRRAAGKKQLWKNNNKRPNTDQFMFSVFIYVKRKKCLNYSLNMLKCMSYFLYIYYFFYSSQFMWTLVQRRYRHSNIQNESSDCFVWVVEQHLWHWGSLKIHFFLSAYMFVSTISVLRLFVYEHNLKIPQNSWFLIS